MVPLLPINAALTTETEFAELQAPNANAPQVPVGVPKLANSTDVNTLPAGAVMTALAFSAAVAQTVTDVTAGAVVVAVNPGPMLQPPFMVKGIVGSLLSLCCIYGSSGRRLQRRPCQPAWLGSLFTNRTMPVLLKICLSHSFTAYFTG